jgi:hypothetical protein
MPIKSKAQRRKFAELLMKGEISPDVYERWNRGAGYKELPERVTPKDKKKRLKKSTRARKATRKTTSARKTAGRKTTTRKTGQRKITARTKGKRSRR